jgi:DtxR family Mn-dependent transcriptional regulator
MVDPGIALLVAIGVLALGYVLFRPRRGLVSIWRRSLRSNQRVRREDALKHIHHREMQSRHASLEGLAGVLQLSVGEAAALIGDLERAELVTQKGGMIQLTATGREAALHILRAHRLWESYLADHTGYPQMEWHDQAEQLEHQLSSDQIDELAAKLGFPTHDPHGDPIPGAEGDWVDHGGMPLNAAELDQPLRIVHIEDEPETVFAQIVAEGLYLGMPLRLIELSPQRVRFWAGDDEHVLAPIVAANISVRAMEEDEPVLEGSPLSDLNPGNQAEIVGITPAIRGLERRRLLDLGILPGTMIVAEFNSPQEDPTAYRIRDSLIALRDDQAQAIIVKPMEAV